MTSEGAAILRHHETRRAGFVMTLCNCVLIVKKEAQNSHWPHALARVMRARANLIRIQLAAHTLEIVASA